MDKAFQRIVPGTMILKATQKIAIYPEDPFHSNELAPRKEIRVAAAGPPQNFSWRKITSTNDFAYFFTKIIWTRGAPKNETVQYPPAGTGTKI